mmetsp:Transcript_19825/g.55149  ORF Transcript_19825/g.55149 Transcript_19825/m.55149 type:complete len:220 (-) Transcript_19825:633-1292(-)
MDLKPLRIFGWYLLSMLRQFFRRPNRPSIRNVLISISLFFLYPYIIHYLLKHSMNICGEYLHHFVHDAYFGCLAIHIQFCFLMRMYKTLAIIEDSVNAGNKHSEDETASKSRRAARWLVAQEFAAILIVVILLLLCLPVFAFWYMFPSICISTTKLVLMFRRLWRKAQQQHSLATQGRNMMNRGADDGGEQIELMSAAGMGNEPGHQDWDLLPPIDEDV